MSAAVKACPVTQEDRDVAWPIWKWLFGDAADEAHFMEGDEDDHFVVQAFARHRLATRPDRDQALEEAAGWQPIETAPKDGTAVLVYFANLEWRDMAGELVTFGALRDHVERTEIGFYQDGTWCESGTAHDMFESWRDQSELPTHWMPLPAPPPTGAA